MVRIEVQEVTLAEVAPDLLRGRHIDRPKPGIYADDRELVVQGWALGVDMPVIAVEFLHRGDVVRRVPMNHYRPDLVASFPGAPDADRGGFLATIPLAGLIELELDVTAVLRDQRRTQLGTIRARRQWSEKDTDPAFAELVSIVIPCYNQARFLNEAIESVLSQTYPHLEVVVIDDGSSDNTEAVVGQYPGVRCIRQENLGLAAARNSGVRHTSGRFLVFLDADDRLRPNALATGLASLAAVPEAAMTYGKYTLISFDGTPLPTAQKPRGDRDMYLALLGDNCIEMHATVMYRREPIEIIGCFNSELRACEDYDLYLRIARNFPVACHDEVIAEYRRHGANMTRSSALLLDAAVGVLRSQWPHVKRNERRRLAYQAGMRRWRGEYGARLAGEVSLGLRMRQWRSVLPGLQSLLRSDPPWDWGDRPAAGRVRFGSLRRVTPIERNFGFNRGQPIDRYYIEGFLDRHALDIRGHVLEISEDRYTWRFGGSDVTRSDVISLEEGNPVTTIVGDLADADHIKSNTFDCIILTQTLHLIYDTRAALKTVYRILKAGGVLLATVPGISQVEWVDQWNWLFTTRSAQRLFEEVFPATHLSIEAKGNVLTASAFLYGLAARELRTAELDYHDPDYQVSILIRAMKPLESSVGDDRTVIDNG